jgi:hypothetical protein
VRTKEETVLKTFIKAPDLKVASENESFETFEFLDEELHGNGFNFPINSVLGMQAEACFEAYLKQSNNFELLAASLQIHTSTSLTNPSEKETLGELDYIVRNLKTEKVVHIELACKFYLYDDTADISEAEKWIGPNRKDSLFEKLEKLRQKQFPLLKRPETLQKLETLGIPKPTSQQLCLKGFLFIPKNMNRESFPKNIQNCIVGHYKKPTDFEEVETARYAIPSKKEWLLPINLITQWYFFSEIKPLIDAQLRLKKSPLIYKKTPHKLERFFVVWW